MRASKTRERFKEMTNRLEGSGRCIFCDSDRMRGEAPKIAELTGVEREIVQLMCEGLKDSQIADHLQLSALVVVSYIESIFEKLEVADRLELVIYAHLHGLAKKPDEDFSERAACRKVGGIAIGDGAA